MSAKKLHHLYRVVSRDFPQKMASALSENPASVIHSLNLAHNTLDNQGNDLGPAEPPQSPPPVSPSRGCM